jgi:hypothetical protein
VRPLPLGDDNDTVALPGAVSSGSGLGSPLSPPPNRKAR